MTKKIILPLLILIYLFNFFLSLSIASPKNLPVPRYVTIKFREVNTRTGPNENCPIEWVFIKKQEPVEIIAEYDQWRKIRDINNEGGWVHSRTLSGKKVVIINKKEVISLLSTPQEHSKIVVRLKPQIRCNLYKCKKDWCYINCNSYKGWIERKFLWGIYPTE